MDFPCSHMSFTTFSVQDRAKYPVCSTFNSVLYCKSGENMRFPKHVTTEKVINLVLLRFFTQVSKNYFMHLHILLIMNDSH